VNDVLQDWPLMFKVGVVTLSKMEFRTTTLSIMADLQHSASHLCQTKSYLFIPMHSVSYPLKLDQKQYFAPTSDPMTLHIIALFLNKGLQT
jgi:hypothetical protein